MRAVFLACYVFLAGCEAGSSSPIEVAAACPFGDGWVQMEAGHYLLDPDTTAPPWRSAAPQQICEGVVSTWLQPYRDEYEARFGHVVLSDRVVRLRKANDLRDTGLEGDVSISGHTYPDAIDLSAGSWESLPHELNHVRTGSGHLGWCIDFEPWSEQVLGLDQRVYLGCR
jgi:hypothetical protein